MTQSQCHHTSSFAFEGQESRNLPPGHKYDWHWHSFKEESRLNQACRNKMRWREMNVWFPCTAHHCKILLAIFPTVEMQQSSSPPHRQLIRSANSVKPEHTHHQEQIHMTCSNWRRNILLSRTNTVVLCYLVYCHVRAGFLLWKWMRHAKQTWQRLLYSVHFDLPLPCRFMAGMLLHRLFPHVPADSIQISVFIFLPMWRGKMGF